MGEALGMRVQRWHAPRQLGRLHTGQPGWVDRSVGSGRSIPYNAYGDMRTALSTHDTPVPDS